MLIVSPQQVLWFTSENCLGLYLLFTYIKENPCWKCAILIEKLASPVIWNEAPVIALASSAACRAGTVGFIPGVVGHFPWHFCNAASCCSSPECQPLLCMSAGHLACDCSSLAPLFWGAAFSFFFPLVKPSLLASHWDLFSYLLLLFAYYKSGSREKFCIKMKGSLKNELVMRAINQSSLQPQQYSWVCWCRGDWMRGLIWEMRNMNYLGLWCGNLLHEVQREAVWRHSHSFPSHKRGCPAGILAFSWIQQFLPAGSTGWL